MVNNDFAKMESLRLFCSRRIERKSRKDRSDGETAVNSLIIKRNKNPRYKNIV